MSTKFETMNTVEIDSSFFGGDTGGIEDTSGMDRGDSFEAEVSDELTVDSNALTSGIDEEEVVEEEAAAPEEVEVTEAEAEATEPEAEQPAEPKKRTRNTMVPRDRLNKEIEARRALEARIAELESGKGSQTAPVEAPAPAITPDQVSKMFEAALDGKNEDAVAALTEILNAHGEAVLQKAVSATDQAVDGRINRDRVNSELSTAAAEVAEQFPEFDSNSEHADQGLIEEVIAMRDLFMNRGRSPAEALRKAANFVASENGLEPLGKEEANPLAAPAAKKTDVKKKLEVAASQPRRVAGSGGRAEVEAVRDVMKMGDDEFAALSRDELARLRGDIV